MVEVGDDSLHRITNKVEIVDLDSVLGKAEVVEMSVVHHLQTLLVQIFLLLSKKFSQGKFLFIGKIMPLTESLSRLFVF